MTRLFSCVVGHPRKSLANICLLVAGVLLASVGASVIVRESLATTDTLANVEGLRINRVHHEFGTCVQRDTVTCSFRLMNASDQRLNIVSISRPCNCITPSLENATISPGKEETLRFVIELGATPGRFRYPIAVVYTIGNDPTTWYKRLELRGSVN